MLSTRAIGFNNLRMDGTRYKCVFTQVFKKSAGTARYPATDWARVPG